MTAARLVPYEDMANPRVHERVVGRKVRAARIAEYDIDTFGLEAFHDGVDGAHHRISFQLEGERSLTTQSGRFRLNCDLGEIEVGPAAHAHGVVQLDELAAGGALAADLVALGAVEDRGHQADHRQHGADHEPDEEGRAFDAADDARAQAHPEREDEIDHK